MRLLLAALLGLLVLAPAAVAAPTLPSPARYDVPPRGWQRSGTEVLRIARARPEVRRELARHEVTYARAYFKDRAARRWQASFFVPGEEIAHVILDDRTGRVLESWTGFQAAWSMARGYPGAFGRAVNSPWIWGALCLLFAAPFLRGPLRLLHLDLAVLLAFSVSYAFFNAAEIGVSVPLAYPLLAYLLVRMLLIARRPPADGPPLRLAVPVAWLGLGAMFLLGFRCGLNVVGSNVIDVGYASVVGADRLGAGEAVYGGSFPAEIERGDTYGPVLYAAYLPFEAALPWSGTWDDLPAAHAAAVAFDALCVLGLWLLGRRIRGPWLGALLAYLWVAFPFTLLVANSNANDGLVGALVVAGLLALAHPVARGATAAAAGLTKFAPLALAPLFVTYRRGVAVSVAAFAAVSTLALAPVALGGDLSTFYERTLAFQNDRGSPFSIWGYYGGLDAVQDAVKLGTVALALVVAFVPRRRDVVTVAALAAAVLIAVQLAVDHWFYLYLVWFLPALLIALLSRFGEPDAGSARWRPRDRASTSG